MAVRTNSCECYPPSVASIFLNSLTRLVFFKLWVLDNPSTCKTTNHLKADSVTVYGCFFRPIFYWNVATTWSGVLFEVLEVTQPRDFARYPSPFINPTMPMIDARQKKQIKTHNTEVTMNDRKEVLPSPHGLNAPSHAIKVSLTWRLPSDDVS